MPNTPREWTFGYLDLVKLTGMSTNAITQQVSRGHLDPQSLESIVIWLSRHARPNLKRTILKHALYEDSGLRNAGGRKAAAKK